MNIVSAIFANLIHALEATVHELPQKNPEKLPKSDQQMHPQSQPTQSQHFYTPANTVYTEQGENWIVRVFNSPLNPTYQLWYFDDDTYSWADSEHGDFESMAEAILFAQNL